MTEPTQKTFAEVIAELTERQANHEKDFSEALAKYDDPTYSEEYEDTLQRKMDEGASDALKYALELLASFDYFRTIA
jgi:NAD(P)H-dependent FMN reductase